MDGDGDVFDTGGMFDDAGNRLARAEVREKPEIVAPDGTNTTFFGVNINDNDNFPNFFGTSAAAPHAAAVAALILEADPSLLPEEVYRALEQTALDMADPSTSGGDSGFDFATGYGLIQADAAIGSLFCPADLNRDGMVNEADIVILADDFAEDDCHDDCSADLDQDGDVDGEDLQILVEYLVNGCE